VRVLRGLSWRIIKSKSRRVRRLTIAGLLSADFLGLMNGDIQPLLVGPGLTIHVV
jgi:hypothetical protein